MKVRQLENKNQFVMEDNQKAIFQSYDSVIAEYDKINDILTLGVDWDYSNTTRKHLYIFLEEIIPRFSQLHEDVTSALLTKNKRKSIQILIDNNIIKYDECMR
jgi:hypothetical protein